MTQQLPIYIFCYLLICLNYCIAQDIEGKEQFDRIILIDGLEDPWNIIYGPDNHLWVTESKTYKILRINPTDGSRHTVLDISDDKNFSPDDEKPWPQGGLMGMALHPRMLQDMPYVYLAYVHEYMGSYGEDAPLSDQGVFFKTKLVRFRYNQKNHSLYDPETIIDTIPGSNDHNGGRMLISKVEGEDYLFYSVGDMGAGQFANAARENHAQDLDFYEGKILRFKLDPGSEQDWIPEDNPFNSRTKSAVYSLGLRNTQGLAKLKINGKEIIYASDHGPYSDDEINIIEKGGNYGHPLIIGYADGNYDGLAAAATDRDELPGAWNTSLPLIKDEWENAQKMQNFKGPIHSFYAKDNSFLKEVLEKESSGESADWKAVAHSGIATYTSDAIPGWQYSLLVTSLTEGRIYRLKLSENGDKVSGIQQYFQAEVRYRDVTVSPDGRSIFLITDKSSRTSGPSEEDPQQLQEKGAIIRFTYNH